MLRKLLSLIVVLAGMGCGILASLPDDLLTRIVMAAIGTMFALPIAVAIGRTRRRPTLKPWPRDASMALAASEELERNYWRDKGHPPFMKPSDALPDKHMFDADRLS